MTNKRLTNEELKIKFPSFYEKDSDYNFQSVYYGDEPNNTFSFKKYKYLSNEERIFRNLDRWRNYIFLNHIKNNDDIFYEYNTFNGSGVEKNKETICYKLNIGKYNIQFIKGAGDKDDDWMITKGNFKKFFDNSNKDVHDLPSCSPMLRMQKDEVDCVINYFKNNIKNNIYGKFIKRCIAHSLNLLENNK